MSATIRRAALLLALLLALLAPVPATAAGDGAPAAADGTDAPWLERGRGVYNARCYFCHGYSGDARTVASTYLDPPPRDFSALAPEALPRDAMIAAVRHGREGTAMQGFAGLLGDDDTAAVVDFIREEFMHRKARPARYHSAVNGWSGARLDSAAARMVTGALSRDVPWERLSPEERRGRMLYDAACVICHDRGDPDPDGAPWRSEALSNDHVYDPLAAPGHHDDYSDPPFGLHERPPVLGAVGETVRHGERLYQANCAFCHAANGTGRNWIGAFLVPAPPDFNRGDTPPTADELRSVVRRGLPGTSMPAWGGVLNDTEIDALVAYLSTAFPAFGGGPSPTSEPSGAFPKPGAHSQ